MTVKLAKRMKMHYRQLTGNTVRHWSLKICCHTRLDKVVDNIHFFLEKRKVSFSKAYDLTLLPSLSQHHVGNFKGTRLLYKMTAVNV